MGYDRKREWTLLSIYQTYAQFFADRGRGIAVCKGFTDWKEHPPREWELEYDHLFRGTDGDRKVWPWASACKDEQVLLDRTTLAVIQTYHRWGYVPVRMEGNPPDYLGELLRFLAYMTAALCHCFGGGADRMPEGAGGAEQTKREKEAGSGEGLILGEEDWGALLQAREDFIQYYVLDTAKAVRDSVKGRTAFKGLERWLERLLQVLAEEDLAFLEDGDRGDGLVRLIPKEEDKIRKALEPDILLVLEKGRHPQIPDQPPRKIPTGGINNCGGICVIRPTVQEGCMLKIDSDGGSPDVRIRACVRGRGYRRTFLHPDRLRYPMKRIGKRGSGKFARISWEEAVQIIAGQWARIRDTYGPGSRYVVYGWGVAGIMRPNRLAKRLLALDGGYLDHFNNYSSACASYMSPYIYGIADCGNSPADLLNTRLLILWGDNPAETVFGPEKSAYLSKLKDKGVKIVVVDPRMSQTAVAFADEWIPIRPSTDSALADAMAYVIWSEGLQDQHFMDTYCLGFDEEHMPEKIPAGESYHAYLFGEKDGIPKTPEWAEKICKIPAGTIRRLAESYGRTKPACLLPGLGPQRHGNGEQTTKGLCMLACLTGNVGIPGGGSAGAGELKEREGIRLFTDQAVNPYPGKIPVFLWTKAIEHGTEMTPGEDRICGVERLESNIKMLVNLAGNALVNQHADIHDTIRILEDETKCEFILCSDIFMTPSARYADILLPATSVFEGENITGPWRGDSYLLKNNQALDPPFACRFEWGWLKEVAACLGLYDQFVDGRPELSQWLEANYEILRQKEKELPDYPTFCAKGGWRYKEEARYIAFEKEIRDPVRYPFATPSGKIEIFSKRLYDFHQKDIPAIPGFIPCPEGPEDELRKKYPLQMIGWHTRRRCHSIHDNNQWQEEVERPGLWIHPADAKARGIGQGQLVEVFNDRGRVRIPAVVTERIMEGVVAMSQGGWYTPDAEGTDIRGSINVLTSAAHPTPLAKGNPQHTNLVQVAVWSRER